MAITKVTLIGADGSSLGPPLLQHLVSSGFTVQVLKRQSSKSPSNYPLSVKEIRLPDDFPEDALLPVLQGQDAVVVTTGGSLIDLQKRIALAAAKAGVLRFIPADFGSVDSESEMSRKYVPLYNQKRDVRLYLQELVKEYDGFSWTSIVCGHYFDWSLQFMHIYPKTKTLDIIDDGSIRASASTLEQVAKATIKVLQKAENEGTKNKILYVQSFCKTQTEIKEALERVTGDSWKTNSYPGEKFSQEQKALMDKGGKEGKDAQENVVWWLGAVDANWTKNEGFAMEMLGLEDEDLDEVIKSALARDNEK